MHLLLTGLNHKSAPLALRERLAVDDAELGPALLELSRRAGLYEAVLLSTCNRTELYGTGLSVHAHRRMVEALAGLGDLDPHELEPHLYRARDAEVADHLFRVAAGLDSLVMGEPQILGQVRRAYELAHEARTTSARLSKLFLTALEAGKAVRSTTALNGSSVSMATIALQLGRRLLGDLGERGVLIVGAGEMCETAAMLATERQPARLVVANRTLSRAERLASIAGGEARRLDELPQELVRADLVVTATGAAEPIISWETLVEVMERRGGRRLVLIDLGVPRDVQASTSCMDEVFLYSVDDLEQIAAEHLQQRLSEVPRAEEVISRAKERYLSWLETLAVVPTIVDLRRHFEEIRQAELALHLNKVNGLDERGRQRVEQLTEAMINRILHEPLVRMKQRAGADTGKVLAESLRFLFALDKDEEGM